MAPPTKRRKVTGTVEAITYDAAARQDYLSGFHKRKQQRIKNAQGVTAEKDRLQKIEDRKQIRDQRKKDLEEHVQAINAMLKKAESGALDSDEEPEGEKPSKEDDDASQVDEQDAASTSGREDEYIDEDKYTEVTIEPMSKRNDRGDTSEHEGEDDRKASNSDRANSTDKSKRVWTKDKPDSKKVKTKKKKFRYESKTERKTTKLHQKAKNAKAAQARRDRE